MRWGWAINPLLSNNRPLLPANRPLLSANRPLLYQTPKDCYFNYLEWHRATRNLSVTIVGGWGAQTTFFKNYLGD
jgi:hypothetical protein